MELLALTNRGLYCALGNFYIDPWRPVDRALITHAHADHARAGMGEYLTVSEGAELLRARIGDDAAISTARYGEVIRLGEASVSFHPAGHILGSAQIRIEFRGQVWVVSGDYKTVADSTCSQFGAIRCHAFVTEATFALPIYRWKPQEEIFAEIDDWWKFNRDQGKASVVYCYALGKAQRMLSGINASIGPIFTHGAVERFTRMYRNAGVNLPPTLDVMAASKKNFAGSLILAPPHANGSTWIRRFGDFSTALASGWMQVRGARRRRAIDRGFVLSDHANWPGLLDTIRATGAETVWITHGQSQALAKVLTERGLKAQAIDTEFEGELDERQDSSLDPDDRADV